MSTTPVQRVITWDKDFYCNELPHVDMDVNVPNMSLCIVPFILLGFVSKGIGEDTYKVSNGNSEGTTKAISESDHR